MKTGLIFSGQGAQAVGMGKSFYDSDPSARAVYDLANSVLGWDLKTLSFEGPAESLTETKVCQPALYTQGFVAYTLLKAANPGLEIAAVGGLSLGELTALAAAGVYDFATGLKIVAQRGKLMQECCEATSGAMAAVMGADRSLVAELAQKCDIDVANFNCPGQIVVSGSKEGIEKAVQVAPEMGIKRVIPLKVAGAYHSRLMRSAAEAFEKFLAGIDFKAPSCPVYTNVTGAVESTPAEIKANLVKQITSSVKWEDDFRAMVNAGVGCFYECGIGGVLTGLAKKIDANVPVTLVSEFSAIPAHAEA
jgi:[acyl-carrier-protein] S-malonyltransferase